MNVEEVEREQFCYQYNNGFILISKIRVGLALNVETRSDNAVPHRVLTDLDIAVYTMVVPASRTTRTQGEVVVPQMLRSYVKDLVYVC